MADRIDPYRAYNFKLVIQDVTEGHFASCSGLGVHVDVIKYREAGNAQVVRAIPGPTTYHDVTLRYGLTDSRELWDWMMTTAAGNVQRKNVSVLMLDPTGINEALRWNLIDAWPREWRGSALDALAKEVAIESLTLVFESLERA